MAKSKAQTNGKATANASNGVGQPEGWAVTPFNDLFVHVLGGDWGKLPESSPDDWIDVSVIRGTEFRHWDKEKGRTAAHRAVKPNAFEKRQLRVGDLIIEISGGGPDQPVGRPLRIDESVLSQGKRPFICSNFCRQVRLSPEIDSSFVLFCLKHMYSRGDFNRFQNQTVNIRNLQFPEFAAETTLPLPPHAEQKRIVAKVEALLERVNQARERLDRVPDLLKRFRQSVLAAACSGQLTADWRDLQKTDNNSESLVDEVTARRNNLYSDACAQAKKEGKRKPKQFDNTQPNLREDLELFDMPPEWEWVDLRFLMDEQQAFCYGVVQPGGEVEGGQSLVRAGDLDDGSVDITSLRTISADVDKAYERSRLEGGEILVTVVGANVGVAAIAPDTCRGFNIARAVAKLPIRDFNARYVLMWMTSSQALSWMKRDAREVARPTLNLEQLRTLPVPLPPIREQEEIARCVDALFEIADQIEQRISTGTNRTEKITQSILAKAFAGELVETEADLAHREARDYEPASVLLERIASEHAATANGKPKAGGKRKLIKK